MGKFSKDMGKSEFDKLMNDHLNQQGRICSKPRYKILFRKSISHGMTCQFFDRKNNLVGITVY